MQVGTLGPGGVPVLETNIVLAQPAIDDSSGKDVVETCVPTVTACTLLMGLRIPPGVGSLAHDSSAGAWVHTYFTMAYVGLTRENLATAQRVSADPEDRVFLFRAPILATVPPTVTRNIVYCQVRRLGGG